MIRVTIELISASDGKRSRLGVMDICNDGNSKDPRRGDYSVRVYRKDADPDPWLEGSVARRGKVKNYPRLYYNVWRLICRALKSAFPEEK